jgi:hypothetical protein
MTFTRPLLGVVGTLLIPVLITSTAHAASTRAEYVAQVDPICQGGISKEKAAYRALRKDADRLKKRGIDTSSPTKPVVRLARRYSARVVPIARSIHHRILLVTPAPGDEAAVSQWLQGLEEATDLFERAFDAFAHRNVHRYKQLLTKSSYRRLNADGFVQDFGFKYCAS